MPVLNVRNYLNLEVFFFCILISSLRVLDPAYINKLKLGDWYYYIDACNSLPRDHPFIISLLHVTNSLVKNPELTVKILITIGFSINFFLVFHLTNMITNNVIISFMSCSMLIFSSWFAKLGIALKNLYGLAFFVSALTMLSWYKKTGRKSVLLILAITSVATILTHTIATILLVMALLVHVTIKKHFKLATLLVTLLVCTVSLISFLFPHFIRNQKIFLILKAFLSNPAYTIYYNLTLITRRNEIYISWVLYIASLAYIVRTFWLAKKLNPTILTLIICGGILFHTAPNLAPSASVAGRFYANVPIIIAPLFGYMLNIASRYFPIQNFRIIMQKTRKEDRVKK